MLVRTLKLVTIALLVSFLGSPATAGAGPAARKARARGPEPQPETLDDAYIAVPRGSQPTSPGYRAGKPGFYMTQVNTNASGNNILGDAANEPSIAVDPVHPNRMAIGWRQFDTVQSNFRQAGYAYTGDGGQTWTFPGVIEPGVFRSDPSLDSDSQGNLYYNSLTIEGADYVCYVFKSTNGGVTWNSGTYAYGGDKRWMTIDKTGGVGDGHIYADWTSWYSVCYPGEFTRSTNGNISYESCRSVPDEPWASTLAVGPDGELYVGGEAYVDFAVVKSTNAKNSGQTVSWDFSRIVDLDGFIAWGGPNPDGILGQTWVAVDRSNGPTRGNVYLLASVERSSNSDPLDVMFSRSTNGGQTWSAPVRVNDDPGLNAWQWFGTMSVAPNGRIDVVWLDTRNDPGGYDSELFYSYSGDAGQSWSPNVRLSDSFNPSLGWPSQNKMGDYFDMVSDNMNAHLAWAGTFNGEQDVYYGRITPSQINIDADVLPDADRGFIDATP